MLSTAWLLLSTISRSSSARGHEGGEGLFKLAWWLVGLQSIPNTVRTSWMGLGLLFMSGDIHVKYEEESENKNILQC